MKLGKASALAVFLLLPATAQAQNWPSFRGAGASGIGDGAEDGVVPPTEWNGETGVNVAWKTAIPGFAHSSPIVWGNRVFVTSAVRADGAIEFLYRGATEGSNQPTDDAEHEWRVYALDKNTGKIVWQTTAASGKPRSRRHGKASQASSTPVTDGKVLVAFFGSQGLHAFDLDGKPLWKQDLGVLDSGWFYDETFAYGIASSPVIYDDLVVVQADLWADRSFLAAYRLSDGREVWRIERDALPSWSSPTVYRGRPRDELIVNGSDYVRAYDPRTGKELWRLAGASEEVIPTPAIADGLIYVTSHGGRSSLIAAIRPGGSGALSPHDGETADGSVVWIHQRGGSHTPSPLTYRGVTYICSDLGILSAYDAKSGKRLYRGRLTRTGGNHYASPVAADGKVYFTNEDGDVIVIRSGPNFEILATNPMGEVVMATPAVSEGVLYVRGMQHLFAVATQR